MSYLIDSDWLIGYLAGRSTAVQLLAPLFLDDVSISLITYGEVYEGVLFGGDRPARAAAFRTLLSRVRVIPLNRPVRRRFAQLRGDLRQQGTPIGDLDLLIAATALHHNLTLVTRNRRHFDRIPNFTLHP